MTEDLPNFTQHHKRALLYIRDVNRELDQDEPANISTLAEESDWDSKYFTRAWQDLEPELIKREKDGVSTRLELTEKGEKVLELYLEMNEVLEK
jgi:predicted transcriptional regulator